MTVSGMDKASMSKIVAGERENASQRPDGFYWIDGSDGKEPAQWLNGKWYTIGGLRGFSDDEITGVHHSIEYAPKPQS